MDAKFKHQKRKRRHRRIRAKIRGTAKTPRLCVFRSSQHIYAQLIDDEKGKIIVSVNDLDVKKGKKSDKAKEIGKMIARKAKDLPVGRRVEKIVFDRGGYPYHGRIKALAEGAREGGLKF